MTIPTSDLNEITQYLRAGNKKEAVSRLREVLRHNGHNVQALIWLGGLTPNLREGIIALERALKLDPDNADAKRHLERWRAIQVGARLITDESLKNLDAFAQQNKRHLAILIDGDNARSVLLDKIMGEAEKYGALKIKRIYGDWTKPGMHNWKRALHKHGIHPIQQFQFTTGKNSTDSAMIIDAMDILHTTQVDGFCLVSSDSDYTRLATRISESGRFIMGIGKQRTPKAFINACDLFVFTETMIQKAVKQTKPPQKKVTKQPPAESKNKNTNQQDDQDENISVLLKKAFDQAVQPDGKAYLGTLGLHLQRLDSGFEPRKYGHRQLSQLIKAQNGLFATEIVDSKFYVSLNGKDSG